MSAFDHNAHIEGPNMDMSTVNWPADYPANGDHDKAAVIFENRTITYNMLDRQSSAFVTALNARGIKAGDCIAYLGANNDIYFPVIFGCLRAGVILLPLNWRCSVPELEYILGDAKPKLIITDAEFMGNATAASPSVTFLVTEGKGGLRELLDQAVPEARTARDPDAPALLMYTSGTTGKPKGVTISHRMMALARHAEIISPLYASWTSNDIIHSAMPNFHMGGMSWMLCGLAHGLTCVLTADVTPQGIIGLCEKYKVNRTFIVPTAIRAVLERMKETGIKLPYLEEIHYGAAPMDEKLLLESIDLIGCRFMHHYGMTENAGTATRLGPEDHDLSRPHLLRSVGKPQPGLELQIRRPDNSICAREEPGEICIRSPTITPGYLNREAATAEAITDGWYHTGDGGYLDNDGFLFLTDRINDMVISGGENIYPIEVENVIRLHPSVGDVGVFGIPDDKWGEKLVAAIETAVDETADEYGLRAHLKEKLAGYKIPKLFIFDMALPRTAVGKIQRSKIRQQYLVSMPKV